MLLLLTTAGGLDWSRRLGRGRSLLGFDLRGTLGCLHAAYLTFGLAHLGVGFADLRLAGCGFSRVLLFALVALFTDQVVQRLLDLIAALVLLALFALLAIFTGLRLVALLGVVFAGLRLVAFFAVLGLAGVLE